VLTRLFCIVSVGAGILFESGAAEAHRFYRGFNRPGNILIADQFNTRVIRVSPAGQIVASYGLPDGLQISGAKLLQ
jgi:hypothetical protein